MFGLPCLLMLGPSASDLRFGRHRDIPAALSMVSPGLKCGPPMLQALLTSHLGHIHRQRPGDQGAVPGPCGDLDLAPPHANSMTS